MDTATVDCPDSVSKKRVAFRQLSKDDDADDEEVGIEYTLSTGTFKRASEEVLASRRILKVRRNSPPREAPSLFSGILLVPPSNTDLKESIPSVITDHEELSVLKSCNRAGGDGGRDQNVEKDQLPDQNQFPPSADSCHKQVEAKIVESSQGKSTGTLESTPVTRAFAGNIRIESSQFEENSKMNVAENTSKAEVATEKEAAPTISLSFQQHSGGKNAFSGSFGTGFSNSLFTSGSTSSPFSSNLGFGLFGSSSTFSSNAFGSSQSTESGLSLAFSKSNTGTAAPFQLFPSQDANTTPPNSSRLTQATVTFSEVPLETGEEKESAVFKADATIFEYVDKAWKERGKGELRVNVSEDAARKARLVMRAKGNLRLLLNSNLFPDMRMNKMDSRSVTFACVNSASVLNSGGLATYALKLKDASTSADFVAVVETCKLSSSQMKTQKNSVVKLEENEELTKEIHNVTEQPAEAADVAESCV